MNKTQRKISVNLSNKAAQYFAEVQYGLPKNPDGSGIATNSQVINECLETLADFEKLTDNQLSNWLYEFKKLTGDGQKFASDPTSDNMFWNAIRPAAQKEAAAKVIRVLMEEKQALQSENEQLKSRVAELEKEVETLKAFFALVKVIWLSR